MGVTSYTLGSKSAPPIPAPTVAPTPNPTPINTEKPKPAVAAAVTPRPVPTPTPTPFVLPTPRPGPGFHEADAYFDDRKHDLTDAQKQAYWRKVSGTQVTWTGEVVEVKLDSGGSMSMRCNPQTQTIDVQVTLDGTQVDLLPSINKGQQVTVRAILQNHTSFGYDLSQGHIIPR